MDIGNVQNLINAETEKRLRLMSENGYTFPKSFKHNDWCCVAGIIFVSVVLISLCMTGVIV